MRLVVSERRSHVISKMKVQPLYKGPQHCFHYLQKWLGHQYERVSLLHYGKRWVRSSQTSSFHLLTCLYDRSLDLTVLVI